MDNEQYLKDLAEKQKMQKQTELDQARARATTELDQQQQQIMPTFERAKQQTNVQSQLGAKNLAEFWAKRGQTSGGISAQAELSRQNVLGREVGAIGQQERETETQFGQKRMAIGQGYEDQLANTRQAIDMNLAENLYGERQKQQEIARQNQLRQDEIARENQLRQEQFARQDQLRQQDFAREDMIRNQQIAIQRQQQQQQQKIDNTPVKPQILKGVLIPHDYGVQNQIKGVPIDNKTIRYQVGNDFIDMPKGVNPFVGGAPHKDTLNIKGQYDPSKVFSNGYQPNNIGGTPLANSGVQANMNGQPQSVWTISKTTGSGLFDGKKKTTNTYYVWDGATNNYISLNKSEKEALGLK